MRSRLALLAAALALFAVAVLAAPAPAPQGGGALGALGSSLGGFRIALVDLLFLRAERLLREGRTDEVPPLYEAILDLDPENIPAVEHLASVYAYDLLGEAPDTSGRAYWWRRAWDMLEEALSRHPDDASLLVRSSDLLLEVAPRDPDLERWVSAFIDDPRRLGFVRLLAAARQTETLPRRGRIHLLRLAVLLPLEAAVRLRDGQDPEPLLTLGDEALALRRDTLGEMRLPGETLPNGRILPGVALDVVLQEGLRAVRRVAAALEEGDRHAGEAAVARLEHHVPDPELVALLRGLVEGLPR